jgi:serine/threonine-protein kinase
MDTPPTDTGVPAVLPVPGDVLLNRYEVTRTLGHGGMGVVYEGRHTRVGRRVAIKCLLPKYANDEEVLRRFKQEARAASEVGNPHIVEVLDMDVLPNGTHFMVLEFLDGRELGKEIKAHKGLPAARAVNIVAQMCEALAAVHARGIVHRDLKPANVFLIERDGNPDYVKILDFGVSKFRDLELTRTGDLVGSPLFMAPEQMNNAKVVDHRADLYALGGVLFAALAGRTPYQADNVLELAVKISREPPPDVRSLRPEVPPELAEVVRRLLAHSPDERFADCTEVHAALRSIAEAHAWDNADTWVSAPPSRLPRAPRSLPRFSKESLVYGGAFTLAIVVSLVVVFATRGLSSSTAAAERHALLLASLAEPAAEPGAASRITAVNTPTAPVHPPSERSGTTRPPRTTPTTARPPARVTAQEPTTVQTPPPPQPAVPATPEASPPAPSPPATTTSPPPRRNPLNVGPPLDLHRGATSP